MEMELFLNECPGIPKKGIFLSPKIALMYLCRKHMDFVITKLFFFKPITIKKSRSENFITVTF